MIDLRSDTVTPPSDEICEVARDAAIGDNMYSDNPIVNGLKTRATELVGKEAALFVPSGAMGSRIAACVHADPG